MSLANKTFSGFIWTFISRIGTRISIFIIGIILARLLSPFDFGLIALLTIFFSIASSLVDSGFTQALIREKTISQTDKTTVFYINLIISVILYAILWFSSPAIAHFFEQPQLVWLARVMGLDIIFKALSLVQRAVLMQSLKFKLLSVIDISVAVLTGFIAIFMAYNGMGVWSLAIKYFLSSLFVSILFFIINPWMPTGFINKQSFNRLFMFGSKLLITGQINILFNNIYNIIIGKIFSASMLGFYDRAFMFYKQAITIALTAIQQVSYPILSKLNEDKNRLKFAHQRLIKINAFVSFPIATVLIFGSESIIGLFLGEKWMQSATFLQLLSIAAYSTPLGSMNTNLFKVIGRSDIFLRVSIYGKIVIAISIVIGLQYGIIGLIVSSVSAQYIATIITMLYTAQQIKYSFAEQFMDFLKSLVLLVPMLISILFLSMYDFDSYFFELTCICLVGSIVYLLTAYISKSQELKEIMTLISPIKKRFFKT